MLSPKVLELEERCIRIERATEAYAPEAAEAFVGQFRRYLTEEEAVRYPDAAGYLALVLHVIGVRMVRDVREGMTVADREDRHARIAHRKQRGVRDAVVQLLYDCVVEVRRRCKTHLTHEEEKIYLGLAGDTPRQPFELTRWADVLEEVLENEAFPISAEKFEAAPYLKDLRASHEKVEAAIAGVEDARRRRQETGHVRSLSIERCERLHLHCSQVVESVLAFVKREDLARYLRGVGRPGRPPKRAEHRPKTDTTEPARVAPPAESADAARSQDLPNSPQTSMEPSQAPRNKPETPSPISRVLRTARKTFSRN